MAALTHSHDTLRNLRDSSEADIASLPYEPTEQQILSIQRPYRTEAYKHLFSQGFSVDEAVALVRAEFDGGEEE